LELTKDEEKSLNGEHGEALQTAYRILSATGEATDAEKLVPIHWAHVSGVNYNTIGDAGEEFLATLSKNAKFKVRTTINPMGYDKDSVEKFGLDENFIQKQESIRKSYKKMGALPTFSCIPYELYDMPREGTQVSFAESNAAIYANSIGKLKTNKESAFSALASAITGKSPYSDLRKDDFPTMSIAMKVSDPNELAFGLLGYFAGKVADKSVAISGVKTLDKRCNKSMCASMGTSGSCGKFVLDDNSDASEKVDFDEKELQKVYDELNTAESGDIVTLGSPQLGLEEMTDLAAMLNGRAFKKRCLIFCPRSIQEQARSLGYAGQLESAGCELMSDCCTCLTPLVTKKDADSVTTNSIKGAYYLKNSNGLDVNLKSLSDIVRDETS
jgi:predicted aconitase